MTDKPAGWYADPSGMPNMFRWWDGRQWTTTLTSDPAAPGPVSPSPVTPPGGSGGPAGGSGGGSGGGPDSGSADHPTAPISQPQQPQQSQQPAQPAPSAQPGQGPHGTSPFAPPGAQGQQHAFPPYAGGQQQQQQQPPPVPPPPGAPGPGYVPPPYDPMGQYTEVLSSDSGNGGGNRKALLFVGIGLAVVLIAGIIGGVWLLNRDDETPTASDNNTEQPQSPEQSPPQPFETEKPNENSPGPRPSPSEQPNTPGPSIPALGEITFTPLSPPWESSTALSADLLQSTAQVRTTETNWDGEGNNWVALASAGYANPTWVGKDSKDTAGKIAEWFARTNFNEARVGRDPLGTSEIKVSGNDGILLKEHFTYDISGLKAKGETVYIAVIDIKGAPLPGVFVGSVPDTNKALQKDVEKAIDSLKVES